MPVNIKIVFSMVVLGVAVAGYFFLDWFSGGSGIARYLALFLGVFSVVSFWIFPEVANTKKTTRKS
jgi:hypothetical protein